MTTEEKSISVQARTIVLRPLFVVLGALLLYGFTLDHWVNLSSLPTIARVTGWDWHAFPLSWRQTPADPLFFILTSPVRILPVAWQPLFLNIFAAVCASLALGLLAASVRLLPQDRTREQRQRETGEYALLSLPTAFLPAVFAVLMMGMQLTFWRSAVAANGDMLDLLVFSFLIYCLLRFRVSQNDNWLAVFSFVYGLGTTSNWALIGFFPFFLVALVWIKGVSFFGWRFLARMAALGAAGLLLYLVVPAFGSLGSDRGNFLSLLHLELGAQTFGLRSIPRWIAAVGALPTLLPLIFAGICWPSFDEEMSAAGNTLTRLMFRLLHVFFLLLALVMYFDFKFSPSLRLQELPTAQFLTFYYLGALCIGYYSGYILLVFGRPAAQAWEKRGPLTKIFNQVIVGLLWLLAVAAPCALVWQNFARVHAGSSNGLAAFSAEALQDLPAKPGIILSDDPTQLYLMDAAFRRAGKPNNNIMIETGSLPHLEYINYLISHYPELKKLTRSTEKFPAVLPADALIKYLFGLSRDFTIYYLHPSFGYYFEAFYLKPHGLIYELKPYEKDVVEPPLVTSQEVKENQDIWARIRKTSLADLPAIAKLDSTAAAIAGHYSVDLDFWGVLLERAGYLKEANEQFTEAARINPQNFIAKINKEYNEHLLKNDHRPIDTGDLIYKAVNAYRGIMQILKYNGPVDEPGLLVDFGSSLADGHDFRQSIILFRRRLQLLPGDVKAQLDLAKVYVDAGLPEKALEMVRALRTNPAASKWDVTRVEALAYYAKKDFPTAEKLMLNALKESPQDQNRVATLAEFYRACAYNSLREKNETEANRRFTNALTYVNLELQILKQSSRDISTPYGVPETLLKKAEIELMLKKYDDGIATLTQIVELQPANATALLNRAIAEVQIKRFSQAKDDYKALHKLLPQEPYVIDYGLAEIALRETNRSDEIRNLRRYLRDAPDNSPEYRQVKQRLAKLENP